MSAGIKGMYIAMYNYFFLLFYVLPGVCVSEFTWECTPCISTVHERFRDQVGCQSLPPSLFEKGFFVLVCMTPKVNELKDPKLYLQFCGSNRGMHTSVAGFLWVLGFELRSSHLCDKCFTLEWAPQVPAAGSCTAKGMNSSGPMGRSLSSY